MRENLLANNVGMPTTEDVVKLGQYNDEIARLSQELGVGDKTSVRNVAAPMSAPETKPFVPTMTEPINRYSQPDDSGSNSDPYAIPENRQTPYTPGVEGGDIGDGSNGYSSVKNIAAPMSAPEPEQNTSNTRNGSNGVGAEPQDSTRVKENTATSPIVPVAGGLYYNTETGEFVDNYNYEGNQDNEEAEEDSLSTDYYIESIFQYYLDKANTNMSSDEFNEKYPDGVLDEWTVELGKVVGWEECQKYINSVSQIAKTDEESIVEPYTIYSNPEEESNENHSGLGEVFMDDVVDREQEKGEIDAIQESLESLLKYANNSDNSNLSNYVQKTLDKIMQNGGLSDIAGWFQKEPDITGNPLYIEEVDGVRIEMETLNEWRLHEFGGNGTQFQEMLDKIKTLYWPPGAGMVNTVLGAIVGDIEDHYNPGQVLQPGDIRIALKTPEWIGTKYKADYFFRESELLYTIAENGVITWGDVVEPPF